jgi:hypothetical protein
MRLPKNWSPTFVSVNWLLCTEVWALACWPLPLCWPGQDHTTYMRGNKYLKKLSWVCVSKTCNRIELNIVISETIDDSIFHCVNKLLLLRSVCSLQRQNLKGSCALSSAGREWKEHNLVDHLYMCAYEAICSHGQFIWKCSSAPLSERARLLSCFGHRARI